MTTFILNMNLDKWLHQNGAEDGIIGFVEGCLLDNMIVKTKRGYAGIYEEYRNSNSSVYRIEFQSGDAPEVWSHWEEFEEENREYEAC